MTGQAMTKFQEVQGDIHTLQSDLNNLLPSHISAEKFIQVAITAIQNNPDLLDADRQSLKVACMNAATDGLLPDKREGAFVIYNTRVKVKKLGSNATYEETVATVQWMPMIQGILKKAHQSGKVSSISVELVYENDTYSRSAGDNAEINHIPLDFGDRGKVRGGYAIIRLNDGGDPYREVMSLEDIEKVKNVSRSKEKGPWVTFWEEMAKKTILRRTLKRVPLSPEVDKVLQRDEVFYQMGNEARPAALPAPGVPKAALFSNRAAVKGDKSKADAEPAPSDIIDAEVTEPEKAERDPAALTDAISKIRHAATAADLFEAVAAARAIPDLTAEEETWITETLEAQQKELGEADGAFLFTALLNAKQGPITFMEPKEWVEAVTKRFGEMPNVDYKGRLVAANWDFWIEAATVAPEAADRLATMAHGEGVLPEGVEYEPGEFSA